MDALRKRHNATLSSYRSELAKLERERKKLVQCILDGVPRAVLKDDAIRIDKRMTELNRLLENTQETSLLFTAGMAVRYRKEIARLIDSLNSDKNRGEATDLIRSLIDKIVLTPAVDRDGPIIDLYGDLAGILSIAANRDRKLASSELSNINPDE